MEPILLSLSQIVWAKIGGSSWWPAIIQEHSKKTNEYSLLFYGSNPFIAKLSAEQIKDYEEYYHEYSTKKTSGLSFAIDQANKDIKEFNETKLNKYIQNLQRKNSHYTEREENKVQELMITTNVSNFTIDNNHFTKNNSCVFENNSLINLESYFLNKFSNQDFDHTNDKFEIDNDSCEQFYFNNQKNDDKVEEDDTSIIIDETNEETILKLGNTIYAVYDDESYKLDDIAFMLNFILIQLRSNAFSTKDLIHKFKIEILMILKHLNDIKEKDSKMLFKVKLHFKIIFKRIMCFC